MNKLAYTILTAFLLTTAGMYAQESASGTPEANFSIYKNKLKKSDSQLTNEKKTSNPKFWLSRAELMLDIFNLHRQFLAIGSQPIQAQLIYPNPKEKKEWTDEKGNQWMEWTYDIIKITFRNDSLQSWEELEVLQEDPLNEAYKSLEKAQEIDVDNKLDKKIKEAYDLMVTFYKVQGGEQYAENDFKGSFKSFAKIAEINEKPIMEGAIDTVYLYYAGLTATKADLDKESLRYYQKALDANLDEPDLYLRMRNAYEALDDTTKGAEMLETGFEKYPDNKAILIELINHYLLHEREEDALEYIKIAQKDDPNNISYIFAEAALYDGMGEFDKAIETYQRCVEIKPDYYDAYFNMGVMYYNKGVELLKKADDIKDPNEYGAAKDKADEAFAKALPYMEKAYELDSTQREAIETLKTLYYRAQQIDKYEEMKEVLENMPAADTGKGGIQ